MRKLDDPKVKSIEKESFDPCIYVFVYSLIILLDAYQSFKTTDDDLIHIINVIDFARIQCYANKGRSLTT